MIRTDDFPFRRLSGFLIGWYEKNKRDLPWRNSSDPYRVWVSEIMLQQTRVEAAKEYYRRFLEELPTVSDLADCPDERLMKLWEGLGYYSRARNMKKTAQIVRERGGEFPCDEAALERLPGIGEYTAGAILSIAFRKAVPAVDGNVLRVMSRLLENPTDISEPAYKSYLKERLQKAYPPEGEDCPKFTQGLMELGALICLPRSPACEKCPMTEICRAYAHGTTDKFPVTPVRKEKRTERVYVFVIRTPSGIAVRKREGGVLKGMNEFPSETVNGDVSPEEILNGWGVVEPKVIRKETYSHVFTHIRWEMICFLTDAKSSPYPAYRREVLEKEVALPTAFRQCARILSPPERPFAGKRERENGDKTGNGQGTE